MSDMSKELLRKYINQQNFTNPNEILNVLKDMFRNMLQESLEAEMDESLVMKSTILLVNPLIILEMVIQRKQ